MSMPDMFRQSDPSIPQQGTDGNSSDRTVQKRRTLQRDRYESDAQLYLWKKEESTAASLLSNCQLDYV